MSLAFEKDPWGGYPAHALECLVIKGLIVWTLTGQIASTIRMPFSSDASRSALDPTKSGCERAMSDIFTKPVK